MTSQFHNREHERLARSAIDPKRLLPGENSRSRDPEDALHWIGVYGELSRFMQLMLAEMETEIPDLPAVAAEELRGLDLEILRKQRDRYLDRLRFWEKRARHLDPARRSIVPEVVSANRSS